MLIRIVSHTSLIYPHIHTAAIHYPIYTLHSMTDMGIDNEHHHSCNPLIQVKLSSVQ